MKKFYLLLVIAFLFSNAYSQRANGEIVKSKVRTSIVHNDGSKGTIDSLLFFPSIDLPCAENLTYYTYNDNGGYVTGNNSFKDKEIAQKYIWTGGGQITGVLALVNSVTQSGNAALKIYSINSSTKGPGTLLATGPNVPLDTFKTQMLHAFPLTTPLNCPAGGFFVSIVLPTATSDTLVCFTTEDGCYVDSTNAWLKGSDNVWYEYSSPTVLAVKFDIAILPVVQLTTDIANNIGNKGIDVQNIPNPAKENVMISYTISANSNVKISICDMTGREVYHNDLGYQKEGTHTINVDLSDFNNGIYFYSIKTNSGNMTRKMVVNK